MDENNKGEEGINETDEGVTDARRRRMKLKERQMDAKNKGEKDGRISSGKEGWMNEVREGRSEG